MLVRLTRHVAAALLVAGPAFGQTQEIKVAHFVTPLHPFSKWIEEWAKGLEQKSGGALKFTIIPGGQMGPGQKYYDIAKTGQADVTWFVHGFTPGRFPLTEVSNMPYLFASGEIASKALNDSELRGKYLDKEHDGLKVLLLTAHEPGSVHTARKPVRSVEDMKGLRIRFSSSVVREYIAALGGTPVGLPSPEIVENMQKGTLDGAFIDYGGAGIAFRMGPVTKYTTELYNYITTFCVCMNARRHEGLPANLKTLFEESVKDQAAEAGRRFDSIDAPGKKAMIDAGMEPIKLAAEEDRKFRAVGAEVTEKLLAELEKKGQPGRAVYALMQALAAKHTPGSNSFWK